MNQYTNILVQYNTSCDVWKQKPRIKHPIHPSIFNIKSYLTCWRLQTAAGIRHDLWIPELLWCNLTFTEPTGLGSFYAKGRREAICLLRPGFSFFWGGHTQVLTRTIACYSTRAHMMGHLQHNETNYNLNQIIYIFLQLLHTYFAFITPFPMYDIESIWNGDIYIANIWVRVCILVLNAYEDHWSQMSLGVGYHSISAISHDSHYYMYFPKTNIRIVIFCILLVTVFLHNASRPLVRKFNSCDFAMETNGVWLRNSPQIRN